MKKMGKAATKKIYQKIFSGEQAGLLLIPKSFGDHDGSVDLTSIGFFGRQAGRQDVRRDIRQRLRDLGINLVVEGESNEGIAGFKPEDLREELSALVTESAIDKFDSAAFMAADKEPPKMKDMSNTAINSAPRSAWPDILTMAPKLSALLMEMLAN
ncbi:hypothetical protein F4811DRAFT_556993 [Daldinia bambusicola]|nr:hypothetical protein F4811DRAFT_556993 [Daldinia bambusicola]